MLVLGMVVEDMRDSNPLRGYFSRLLSGKNCKDIAEICKFQTNIWGKGKLRATYCIVKNYVPWSLVVVKGTVIDTHTHTHIRIGY